MHARGILSFWYAFVLQRLTPAVNTTQMPPLLMLASRDWKAGIDTNGHIWDSEPEMHCEALALLHRVQQVANIRENVEELQNILGHEESCALGLDQVSRELDVSDFVAFFLRELSNVGHCSASRDPLAGIRAVWQYSAFPDEHLHNERLEFSCRRARAASQPHGTTGGMPTERVAW